ncbi:tetratricopeptide repeat protein [Desulfovibrio desulfuricans]|uniref:Tetratricopeptide repeat protein n=1 Tax=Desulfovibrio desulfuricans TaxID=876 RepID=A0A4P7UG15_DESDE|nr:tetratricopeptide repeat protein [Desulfovibrio desulfuricans]QCC84669.1 tetratricopeptide repeat protein [Desulfovibrio desulfuricans]
MNPQKNQGVEESPLLRDLQAEVSSESAPMLQFMLRHAGTIASIVVLFVLVLAGTGIWRWYTTSKNDEARQSLARIVLQTSGPAQIKELAALAEKAPADVRFSVYLALGQSAMSNGDNAAAADAFAKAAKEGKSSLALVAGMNEAGALLKAGKYAEALAALQKLQSSLPGEVTAPQLKQMTAEAAVVAGQPEQAARMYLALAREAQGLNSEYFRARATALAPKIVDEEAAQAASPAAPDGGADKAPGKAQ